MDLCILLLALILTNFQNVLIDVLADQQAGLMKTEDKERA